MIGIKAIQSYIPSTKVDNIERARGFGETEQFLIEKIGSRTLPRKESSEDTSDLALKAVHKLLLDNPMLTAEKVDALVVVTQNGDHNGLPHTSAILQDKLNFPASIAAFDISLGCSGYVYGLHILKGFLESCGLKNGILVTADPYSKIIDKNDKVTSLLFGDAATATWLGDEAVWAVGPSLFGTDGSGSEHLKLDNEHLHMNGRQVFNFAATKVGPHINQLLDSASLKPEDVDLFCLHQGSLAIVDAISRKFPSVKDRFVKDMEGIGNTVSSSIPILLETRLRNDELATVLLSGFGVGLSWGSLLLLKNKDI